MKFFASIHSDNKKVNVQFMVKALSFEHALKKVNCFCSKHFKQENCSTIELRVNADIFTLKNVESHIITVGKNICGEFLYQESRKNGGYKKARSFETA